MNCSRETTRFSTTDGGNMKLFDNPIYSLPETIRLFSDTGCTPKECYREDALREADKALSFEIPPLPANLYMEYAENGNRNNYETPYFQRRTNLDYLIIGALYDKKEAYIRKMIDIIWAVCEESSWVIPAHSIDRNIVLNGRKLADTYDRPVEVDLFSSATGAVLSMAYYFFKEDFDRLADGVVSARIEFEIKKRILEPFAEREIRCMYRFLNNWVSWVSSNVLLCAAIFEKQQYKLRTIVSSGMMYMDRLVGTYADDCGCNEGASYWTVSVATLFDAAEIICDITDGQIDVTSHPFFKKACRYIFDMCIDVENDVFVNFADCGNHVYPDGDLVYRMGRKLNDGNLVHLGTELRKKKTGDTYPRYIGSYVPYRIFKNLFDNIPAKETQAPLSDCVYKDLQVAVFRRNGGIAVIKGGHNGESHNHNDLGTVIVFNGNEPVFIDVGPMEYTKDTFGPNRYNLWINQSLYHNVPEINGCAQHEGREYRTSLFEFSDSSATVEYSGGYGPEAGADKCLRTLEAEESGFVIKDSVSAPGSCIFSFMTKYEPRFNGKTAAIGNATVSFDGADCIETETIILESGVLKRNWNTDRLYRTRITSHNLTTTISF